MRKKSGDSGRKHHFSVVIRENEINAVIDFKSAIKVGKGRIDIKNQTAGGKKKAENYVGSQERGGSR